MIQFPSNISGYHRTDAPTNSPAPKVPEHQIQADVGDYLSRTSTQSLREALAQSSEIRPAVVARGKTLLADLSYPPRMIIESLSKLMIASRDPSTNS